MRVILIHANADVTDRLSFSLESIFGFQALAMHTSQEAIDHFLSDQEIDLLICEDNESNSKVLKFLLSTGSQVPALVIKDKTSSNLKAYPDIVIGSIKVENLVSDLESSIKAGIKSGRIICSSATPEYCRIKTTLLTRVCPLKSDIYIRLSSIKFVKMFKQGDTFDKTDLDHFLEKKKIEYLYLKTSESGEFLTKFKTDLMKLTQQAGTMTTKSATEWAGAIHEAIQDLGTVMGYTPDVELVAKQGVALTMRSIGNAPRLSQFLSALNRDKGKYISSHSIYLAQVSCAFAAIMNWPSDTTFQKLTFAALFHDIVLTNQLLAQISTPEEFAAKTELFTDAELSTYKNHPFLGSEIVKNFTEIPPDVDQVILQHHETSDGRGFPRGVTASHISPLASLFIIAHDFVDQVFKSPEFRVSEFIDSMEQKYTDGHFKKIATAFRSNRKQLDG